MAVDTIEPDKPGIAPEAWQVPLPSSGIVFDSHEAMLTSLTKEERAKHYIAEQFALGPLGDRHVTSVRFKLPDAFRWDDDGQLHYTDGRYVDDHNPFNDETVDPTQRFSSSDEFSTLVNYYRSRQTAEQRESIDAARQSDDEALTNAREQLRELIESNLQEAA